MTNNYNNHYNNRQQLNEGLRTNDLKNLVYPVFEVDTYRSKMGEDRDVCVVSFTVKDRSPARDLMEFIEKGFHQVLDADISSGENENGEYFVFVEFKRTPTLAEDIKSLLYGVRKLTDIDEFKFRYHKQAGEHEVSEDTLKRFIPMSPVDYDGLMTKVKTEDVKQFFSKTLMDDLTLDGDVITIHKPFDQKIQLKMVKEDNPQSILEGIEDTIAVDEQAASEMFWLTKVIGDYDIAKFGDNFLFTNGDRSMLLKRL